MSEMDLQQYQDINEATYKTLKFINEKGFTRGSRNGEATFVNNYQFSIDNIKDRYLHLKGRTSNIYAQLMELLWVLSGTTSIEGLFTFLLPRAPDYSDDGKTWRGGYGARLFNKYKQLDNALEQLLNDPYTRQAVFNIWSHEKDTKVAVNEQGFEFTKDIPCSNFGWFWVDKDNKLNMKMHMRSNDCIAMDTEINLALGGTKTLKQLCEEYPNGESFWVIASSEDGVLCPALAHSPRYSTTADRYVKITTGKSVVKATEEHLFMLRDGTYIEAKNLKAGDKLMPYLELGDNDQVKLKKSNFVKVVSVEIVEEKLDFGDITVDGFNNFAINSDIIVHNCLFGMSHINILEFTALLEIMHTLVKQKHPDIQLGKYYHNVINMHFYENTRAQVERVLSENKDTNFERQDLESYNLVENVKSFSQVQEICSNIYESLNKYYKSSDEFNNVVHSYISLRERLGDCLLTQSFLLLISFISENSNSNRLFDIEEEIISNNLSYHKINPSLAESLRMSKKTPQYILDYIK